MAEQPEAWRLAVENLIASTRSPDQPWGCVGGEVDLEVRGSTATLTVVDDQGHAISREVNSPEDVGPLGEALLAKPIVEPEKVPAPVSPENKNPESKPAVPEAENPNVRDPRLLAALTLGPRYAGPDHLFWGSFTISAAVPFRPFGAGVWLRYDAFSTARDDRLPSIRELCLGAVGYRSKSFGRVEIRPAVRPSLAIVTRKLALNNNPGGPGPQPQQPQQQQIRDDTQLDFRFGMQTQILIELRKRLRLVVGIDAEFSPEQVVARHKYDRAAGPILRIPVYTVGMDVGLEVAVP